MDELLDQLKSRIQSLLTQQNQLLQKQRHSEHQHSSLQQEKKLLQEKHRHAISLIERMIARLKLLEKSQL